MAESGLKYLRVIFHGSENSRIKFMKFYGEEDEFVDFRDAFIAQYRSRGIRVEIIDLGEEEGKKEDLRWLFRNHPKWEEALENEMFVPYYVVWPN